MQFNQTLLKCQPQEVSYKDLISPDMICARPTLSSKERGGTCQGDSGGPLTVKNRKERHELVGITSFGGGCAEVKKSTWVS